MKFKINLDTKLLSIPFNIADLRITDQGTLNYTWECTEYPDFNSSSDVIDAIVDTVIEDQVIAKVNKMLKSTLPDNIYRSIPLTVDGKEDSVRVKVTDLHIDKHCRLIFDFNWSACLLDAVMYGIVFHQIRSQMIEIINGVFDTID